MIYLYVTPSGIVNLIEGYKMPKEPMAKDYGYSSGTLEEEGGWMIEGYEAFVKAMKEYPSKLQSAKEQSLPVDDQIAASKKILYSQEISLDSESLESLIKRYIKPDTIYGPFDIEYRILKTTVVRNYLPGEEIERNQVAILLPEKNLKDVCSDCGLPRKAQAFCGSTFHHQQGELVGKLEEKEERCPHCGNPVFRPISKG